MKEFVSFDINQFVENNIATKKWPQDQSVRLLLYWVFGVQQWSLAPLSAVMVETITGATLGAYLEVQYIPNLQTFEL